MNNLTNQSTPLPWWAAGILLGLVQIFAISLVKPLEVSTQIVSVDMKALESIAPEYTANHPLRNHEEFKQSGYGWWFNIGLIIGAFFAVMHLRRWKIQASTIWWRHNHDAPIMLRLVVGLCGGFLILLGAGFAYGGTTGMFLSGWTQLAISAIPFTISMFGFGMLAAYLVYPKIPGGIQPRQ
jgi:uncharacterized BrkB/YihY/UPF0761 family membrane protein